MPEAAKMQAPQRCAWAGGDALMQAYHGDEGGVPEGETFEAAAGRELREETGLVAGAMEPLGGLIHLSNSASG